MSSLTLRLLSRTFLVAALGAFSGCAADSNGSTDDDPALEGTAQALTLCPKIPDALAVPAGNHLAFVLEGRGVQIYGCKPTTDGTSYAWTFIEPDAKLYGLFHFPAGHHYVGPTWEALDGSTVVGTKLAGATVDATAIPWLLLQGTSHTGNGRMSKVTYVQRLETTGGLAPTTGCDAAHANAEVDVRYTAQYAFYR